MNDQQSGWVRLACCGCLLLLLACLLGLYFAVFHPGVAYWNLVAEVGDDIQLFYDKCPADIDAEQWNGAVAV